MRLGLANLAKRSTMQVSLMLQEKGKEWCPRKCQS